MQLIDELRAATRTAHERIELLPTSRAMADGTIGRAGYAALLADLVWVHRTFEAGVAECPAVAAVWPSEAVRAEAAVRDLAAIGGSPAPVPSAVVAAWRDRIAAGGAAAWGGGGYVLEGSRMGGRLMVEPLSRGLGLSPVPGGGLDYHLEGRDDPGGRWRRVREALAALDTGPADRVALVAAAVDTFEMMTALFADRATG